MEQMNENFLANKSIFMILKPLRLCVSAVYELKLLV